MRFTRSPRGPVVPAASWSCRLVVALALALALPAGCTLAGGYPEPSVESCTGGRDDDLDGEIDCDDRDCWGHCPEESVVSCANGRDDDGDGYADHHDPGCWPHARVELTRCRSVAGSEALLAVDDSEWRADGVEIVDDPAGSGARVWAPIALGTGELRSHDAFTGSWGGVGAGGGTRLSTRLHYGGASQGEVTFYLGELEVRAGNLDLDGSEGIRTGFFGDRARDVAPDLGAGWRELTIQFEHDGGSLVAVIELLRPDASVLSARYVLPSDWPAASALEVHARLTGAVHLDAVHVERPAHLPCERPEPNFEIESLAVLAARGPEGFCVMTPSATLHSVDGVVWTTGPAAPAVAAEDWNAMPLQATWDAAASVFRAVVLADGDVAIATSPDCETWSVEGAALPASAPDGEAFFAPIVYGFYGYLRRDTPAGPVHEVWAWSRRGDSIDRATSASGAAGTFGEVTRFDLGALIGPDGLVANSPPPVVTAVGPERLYVVRSESRSEVTALTHVGYRFFVERSGGGFAEVDGLRVGPSYVAGTFDELGLGDASTLLLAPTAEGWAGHMLLSAVRDLVTLEPSGASLIPVTIRDSE